MEEVANSEKNNQKKEAKSTKENNKWYGILASLNKFRRSSFLSIAILIVIFLFVQGLDQAYTLLVDMVEDTISGSLVLCYVIVSVFALIISHYPIYIYYAKDINDSKDENFRYIHKLGFYKIFTFNKKPPTALKNNEEKKDYSQDYNAKYLRYALGLTIFSIWTYYIYKTYEPKLSYEYGDVEVIWVFNLFLYIFPYILMVFALREKQKIEKQNKAYKEAQTNADNPENSETYQKFYTFGVITFYIITVISITLLILATFFIKFNTTSYYVLQFLTLSLSLTYLSFRLFRSKLYTYKPILFVKYIEVNFNYVMFFFYIALLILAMLIYCNIGVAYDLPLPNAMAILFGYFYIIYYGLACLLKYLFVIQAIQRQGDDFDKGKIDEATYNEYSGLTARGVDRLMKLDKQTAFVSGRKKITGYAVLVILVFVVLSFMRESYVHQLENYEISETDNVLDMKTYLKSLDSIKQKGPIIFVASHGGALKANIWTMKLLNHLQEATDGKFLDQTASFSGASGGMMGLSMYAVLSGQYPNNYEGDRYENINARIDAVALKNYASMDISYTLGWDFVRKIIGVHLFSKHRDRAYYSMVAYQNLLEGKENLPNNRRLTSESFQGYWKNNIYDKNGYFPAILVNTAKTNGRRGVFCSVSYDETDKDLFLNADNLSQLAPLDGKKTAISFYQAVSCTNRFPGFSPAAKIKGYGHYIDAGAIDNSGLLTSLDWYDRLKNTNDTIITPKTNAIFVEIINGKTNYIKRFVENFKEKYHLEFIEFNEKEQGNLSAVVSAGANLDKNPDYFSDLVKRLEKRGQQVLDKSLYEEKDSLKFKNDSIINSKKYKVTYMPIYLPRVIKLDDVESFIGGKIHKKTVLVNTKGKKIAIRKSLEHYLDSVNKTIYAATEDRRSELDTWETYEPTLARHLSKSTVKYYDHILKYDKNVEKKVCELIEELNVDCKVEEEKGEKHP